MHTIVLLTLVPADIPGIFVNVSKLFRFKFIPEVDGLALFCWDRDTILFSIEDSVKFPAATTTSSSLSSSLSSDDTCLSSWFSSVIFSETSVPSSGLDITVLVSNESLEGSAKVSACIPGPSKNVSELRSRLGSLSSNSFIGREETISTLPLTYKNKKYNYFFIQMIILMSKG